MDNDIINPELVKTAIQKVRPAIEEFMAHNCKRQELAIVVTGTQAFFPDRKLTTGDDDFIDTCIREEIRNSKKWEHPFDVIALSKAQISARTGKGTAELPPHYRFAGETVWWGSVVLDDIVVACSGVEPWYDTMFSGWIAATIKALAFDKFEKIDKSKNFIGA